MQYLFHHSSAQRWVACDLNFAHPPPKSSIQPRPMPSLRPSLLVQQLRKSITPLLRNVSPRALLLTIAYLHSSPSTFTPTYNPFAFYRRRDKRRSPLSTSNFLPSHPLLRANYIPHTNNRPPSRNDPTIPIKSLLYNPLPDHGHPNHAYHQR